MNALRLLQERIRRIVLIEGRVDDAKRKFPDFAAQIDALAKADPSGNQKYLMKGAQWVSQGADPRYVIDLIDQFHAAAKRLKQKDINAYGSPDELNDALMAAHAQGPSKTQQKKSTKQEGAEMLYDDGRFFLVHIKSKEASCHYGAGTKWCITMKGEAHFEEYAGHNAVFYFLIDREAEPKGEWSKLAFAALRDAKNRIKRIELYDATDRKVSASAAANSSPLPIKKALGIVEAHAPTAPKGSLARLLSGEKVSAEEIAQWVNHESADVRASVAENPNAAAEALSALSSDKDVYVRMDVAKNPNTPAEALSALSRDKGVYVRLSVIMNPNTPAEALSALSRDEDESVRWNVAKNPNAPAEVLSALSRDKNVYVRYGVAENPNAPAEILSALSRDKDADIRRRAKESLKKRR